MVSHQAPFARLLIYASLHIFYIRSYVAILRSGALGSFLRSGFALTLDAQLVAFRLADAVVGGNGDILHIDALPSLVSLLSFYPIFSTCQSFLPFFLHKCSIQPVKTV